jgi:hypothetical protein
MELMLGRVPAPQAEPRPKGSLRIAAKPGTVPPGVDWGKGVITWPESPRAYRIAQDCTDELIGYGDPAEYGPVAARPFVIQTVTHCPRTNDLDAIKARAARHLESITSSAVARELWTGEATQADPWDLPAGLRFSLANPRPAGSTANEGPYLNPYLEAGSTALLTGAADSIADAIGRVESEVADRTAGGDIYLHVPSTLLMGLEMGQLQQVGNLLMTPLGSLVVTDFGYPPDPGDAVGDLVVYGTGPVTVYLGGITVFDQSSWIVDHTNNQISVWAERSALVLFDPQTLVGCTVTA